MTTSVADVIDVQVATLLEFAIGTATAHAGFHFLAFAEDHLWRKVSEAQACHDAY